LLWYNDVTQKDETPGTEKIKQWDNEKLKSFVGNIDQVQVNDILSQLTDMGEKSLLVNLPTPLSLSILPLHINILLYLQNSSNKLPK
jgi:hypothetical protein